MLSAVRKEDHKRIIIAAKNLGKNQKNLECVGQKFELKN